jgi:hypothetical protein
MKYECYGCKDWKRCPNYDIGYGCNVKNRLKFKTPKWYNRYAKLHEWFDIHFRKKHYMRCMTELESDLK